MEFVCFLFSGKQRKVGREGGDDSHVAFGKKSLMKKEA
jgi:hypothetical protein